MKTYLFDTINRFKRFSKQLDAKTIICDKAWQVFNDSGEKELYIFNTDGTVLITLNGVVTHGTWQFIAANDSLIITAANQSYMVHPAFLDDCLFALQVDGTDQVAFLIDQKNSQSFAPQTYQQVIDYFADKEKQELLEIERKRKQEEEMLRRKAEEDRLLREQEEKRKREEDWMKKSEELKEKLTSIAPYSFYKIILSCTYIVISIILIALLANYLGNNIGEVMPFVFCVLGIVGVILLFIVSYHFLERTERKAYKKNIQKYIDEHRDDPRIAYLKQYMDRELK